MKEKAGNLSARELNDIINWDVETWKVILPVWEKELKLINPVTATCIEVGSREGGISLWMTLKGFKITCSDIHYDLEEAKALHKKYKVTDQVRYQKTDLLNWEEPGKYDVIVFKSVLGALQTEERIQKAVDNIYWNLKPGGLLLFAENNQGSIFHQYLRKNYTDWGSSWFYFDDHSLQRIFSKFEPGSLHYNGVLSVAGNRTFLKGLISGLDKFFLNKVIPRKLRYIVYGVFKKLP